MTLKVRKVESPDPAYGSDIYAVELLNEEGYKLRLEALKYALKNVISGKSAGSLEEQATGRLAELVVRKYLPTSLHRKDTDSDTGHDLILSPDEVKLDVKCRGGQLEFQFEYSGRETKHNLYARQVFEENYDAEMYLFCHLQKHRVKKKVSEITELEDFIKENRVDEGILNQKTPFPGTKRQRSGWVLYICGWISKERAKKGIFLPEGSLSERGGRSFSYRDDNIEIFNKNLNGIEIVDNVLSPLNHFDRQKLEDDKELANDIEKNFHITSADVNRIIYDLKALEILTEIPDEINIKWEPILHPNQYHHVIEYLKKVQGLEPDLSLFPYEAIKYKPLSRVKAKVKDDLK